MAEEVGERKLRRCILTYISESFYLKEGDKGSGIASDPDTDERTIASDFLSCDI